jgi:tetratricopeptide (TPR) repeat protein
MAAIEKEYATAKGEPLKDEELKKQIESALALLDSGKARESAEAFEAINRKVSLPSLQTDLGVAYQKAGDANASSQAFATALKQDPNYAAAHHNLGLVKASRGELVEAREHFEKASEIGEGKALAKAVQEALTNHDYEVEPNDEPAQANILPLEKMVAASIAGGNDTDFFRITTPPKYRDIIQVRVENESDTLSPEISVFDSNKSRFSGNEAQQRANLDHSFSVQPETVYFIQVFGHWQSTGRYTITVKPLKKYDAYEPNDSIRQAAVVEIGKQIDANIMDDRDVDFYRFKTGAKGGTVKVHIENQSDTLSPEISVFDSNKSRFSGNEAQQRANLDHSFSVQPETVYFVEVSGHWQSTGEYWLMITQQ